MPHQCVRCNRFYEDGSNEIIEGCSCGAKLFFFIRQEKLEKLKEAAQTPLVKLNPQQREQIEKDVFTLMGKDSEEDEPIVLDFESINVKEPGKFELDLVHLFNKENPLVFKLEEGKYIIDLPKTFKQRLEESRTNR